jgi:CHAT domain-containing protein
MSTGNLVCYLHFLKKPNFFGVQNSLSPYQTGYRSLNKLSPLILVVFLWNSPALSQLPTFVAPPRSIVDVTTLLDQIRPDKAAIQRSQDEAEAQPLADLSNLNLARFYFARANARSLLGRTSQAVADAERALTFAITPSDFTRNVRQFIALEFQEAGNYPKALDWWRDVERLEGPGGWLFNLQRNIEQNYLNTGNAAEAEVYLKRNLALIEAARAGNLPFKPCSPNLCLATPYNGDYSHSGKLWESNISASRALFYAWQGRYRDAELANIDAESFTRSAINTVPMEALQRQLSLHAADNFLGRVSRMKALQGRLVEAEVDARTALLSQLNVRGKYNIRTIRYILGLADVLGWEGRYSDAERLIEASLDIIHELRLPIGSGLNAESLSKLGTFYSLEHKTDQAQLAYIQLEKAVSDWDPKQRAFYELDPLHILSLYTSGRTVEGVAAARTLVERKKRRVGEMHADTAEARGVLAVGLAQQGDVEAALREFGIAFPILIAKSQENANEDDPAGLTLARRSQRVQDIGESYIGLLARSGRANIAVDTFTFADAMRGYSVNQAIAESSARRSTLDLVLSELLRRKQDLNKEINAQLSIKNNALSSGPDRKNVEAITVEEVKLRNNLEQVQTQINQSYPEYARRTNPIAPSVAQLQSSLSDGEALVSFYFGRTASFVWIVPQKGKAGFATIETTRDEIEEIVKQLRTALEPQGAMVSDIPAFDLKLAYHLYEKLLKPVEQYWKSAKSLVVVTNTSLGLLPLSLLPTAPAEVTAQDDGLLFSGYRNVPWLARTHAITQVPSATSLRALRELPPGRPSRQAFVGFGDPIFSIEQQIQSANPGVPIKTADAANAVRGVPLNRRSSPQLDQLDSAQLGLLPRLPDTAEELKSIALALHTDPDAVLHLGKDANESNVRSIDLSAVKVIAFSTHGLVPGELDGLTQPALALSAPEVANINGNGLLTMEKIFELKLDADWVVLSACNTNAGAAAGAEAASGLGRAFFYAGTRALLVTNWSVHSRSARELVTDLFRRQADDPKISRGEALRESMLTLMDGPGYVAENGKSEFAYAHPLFWAPYSIIGDGGAR